MPRFFVPAAQVAGGRARILGDDAAHLARSLRAAPGERVVVADDAGMEHGVCIESVDAGCVEGAVEWSRPLTGEPAVEVHVVQALAKDGMDELVEALAEAGAAAVWPVLTLRTVARPDARRAAHRVERWQAIARNAAMLAGRGRPPVVHEVQPLPDALAALPAGTRVLACAVDGGGVPLVRVSPVPHAGERVALVIGPEGGLDASEIARLRDGGAQVVHLGPRVLRARLAGVVALSALSAVAGDLDVAVAVP
jgi:16S rRNA (uracil1498-N3)-methyltransferase